MKSSVRIESCPHLRGKFILIWGIAKCSYYRGVIKYITGVSFKRGSTVYAQRQTGRYRWATSSSANSDVITDVISKQKIYDNYSITCECPYEGAYVYAGYVDLSMLSFYAWGS